MTTLTLNSSVSRFDALIPPEMAAKAEEVGVEKACLGWRNTIALGVLAGAFISMGAIFATTVTSDTSRELAFGVYRVLGGISFCLGLILVIVAGAELFTGNILIVMAWANRRISTTQVFRNWGLVYIGNFIGSIATVVLMFFTRQYAYGNCAIGINILTTANAKCTLGFIQAVALGIGCNALVCLAVWLCYSARTTTDKILSIIFPITAFVAIGFEHCVANMYFIPMGLFVKAWSSSAFWEVIEKTTGDFADLTWINFIFVNLLPVTLGNMIGGSVMVGMVYWFIYLRKGYGLPPKN